MTSRISHPVGNQRPRLTLRGALILLSVFLTIGPTSAYGIGIPLDVASGFIERVAFGKGLGPWQMGETSVWTVLVAGSATMVMGLPFYGWWADTHLWHLAAWIACCVILVASSRRGIRIRDASVIGAAAVLAFPFLVDMDGPHLTWGYPDAVFMAAAAAGGAAFCTAIVRGMNEAGMRKRVEWGWLVQGAKCLKSL